MHIRVTVAAFIFLLPSLTWAQEYRGAIEGRISDSSGAALPGATVAVTHIETGIGSVAVANSVGRYQLPLLQPGFYKVIVELQGFRRIQRDRVAVRVEDRVVLDFTLEIGKLDETVIVTAETPVLDSVSGSAGQVIDQTRIELMPMSDGNPFTLTRLASGVVPFGDLRYFRPFDNNATAEFSAAGAPTSNAFTLDGSPNQAHRQGNADSRMAFIPPSSAVQEFKVQTATFDAQHGRAAGATVNVAMKTGTNTYRGDTTYYYRDESMAENDFFLKLRGQPEVPLDYRRTGFSLGGPLQLGRLYNGKNKTFFFTAVEFLNDRFPDASQRSVPTVKQRNGDFSELLSRGFIIYDPATAFLNAAGRVERLPFPGNIIPPERIHPIARAILQYYPLPNQPGDADLRTNYISAVTRDDDYYTYNIRMDHQLTNAHKIYGRYSHNERTETRGHWAGEVNGVRPTGFYMFRINDAAGLDYLWAKSSTSLFNVRTSWNRFDEFDKRQTQDVFDPSSLGFSPQTAALFGNFRYFPQIDLNRYDDIGTNWLGGTTTNNFSVQPTWTKLKGRHSIKTGYDLRVTYEDERLDGHPAGLYQFRETYTRQSETSASLHTQDLASLLLGIPTGGRIETMADRYNNVIYHGVFIQDDWKATDRLTLNLGLRYEFEGSPTERFNRNVRGFDPDVQLPITAAAEAAYAANPIPEVAPSAFRVRGGVGFTDEENRGFWNADRNNFQPRLGFAYRWFDKSVIRGGWAIYTAPAVVDGVRLLGFQQQTPIVVTNDRGQTFRANLFNPFPDGMLPAPGQALGAMTRVGQDIDRLYHNLNFNNGQAMRWVLSVQRELPGQVLAEASYVGSYNYSLTTNIELDAIDPAYLSRSPLRDDVTNAYLTAPVPNPFAGLLPGTNLNGATVTRLQLLRPFPHFDDIEGRGYDGSSKYSSLQVKLDKRFTKGLSLLTNYTFSRSRERVTRLNEADTEYEERPTRTDVPHRFVLNPIWELPFGRDRKFARDAHAVLNGLIGGWSIALVYQYQSGQPLTLGNEYFGGDLEALKTHISTENVAAPVFDVSGFYLPDAVGEPRNDRRLQLVNNYRTLPSRLPNFRGMPQNYWDMSLVKKLALGKRARAQFHIELYNATNSVWFRAPNVDPQNADFGRVTSQGNLPREVQLGAKFVF